MVVRAECGSSNESTRFMATALKSKFGRHKSVAKEFILFLGNTGVGKSAICNALGGSCKSATRTTSVTIKHSLHEVQLKGKDVVLIDAPGLFEPSEKNVQRNIDEISAALNHGGNYRLIFVICLQGGRFSYEDGLAMKSITKAVKRSEGPIGVILNKLEKAEMEMLEDEVEACNLLRSVQLACGADAGTGTRTSSENSKCEILFSRVLRDGVGDNWHGVRPHAELTQWLISLVSTKIIAVEQIQIENDGEFWGELSVLRAHLEKEKEERERDKQQAASDAQALRKQMERLQHTLRTATPMCGTPKPLVTRVTDKSHLPMESINRAVSTVRARFENKESEFVEIYVDKAGFKRAKTRGSQVSYWVLSTMTLFVHPVFSWMISTSGMDINTRKTERLDYEAVTKIESIIEGRTTHTDPYEFRLDKDGYDNTNTEVDSEVRHFENSVTEISISHTLGTEVALQQVNSMLLNCGMTLPNFFSGSGQLANASTSTARVMIDNQSTAVSSSGKAMEMTFDLRSGTKVVIEKWCKEEAYTTHYSTITHYDGLVMWCGRFGDRRAIPAALLWPEVTTHWEVTQMRKESWCKVS